MNPIIFNFNSIQPTTHPPPPLLPSFESPKKKHRMFDPSKNPRSRYDSYGSYGVLNRGSEFVAETDDSGESTPPLWRTSPDRSLLRPNQYRDLSPEAKTQAIVRGQMELMEMVGRMPESSYELSLKDLVKHPFRQDNFMEEQRVNVDHEISTQRREQEVARSKNNDKKLQMMSRNGSIENKGFLLKMGFPVSNWGSGKKKKKKKDSKVLPKQPVVAVAEGGGGGEKEWWKKRYVGSAGESESVGLSSNSGSSKSSGSSSSRSSSKSSSRCVLD